MSERDMRPAVGTPGGPASWRRAVAGAAVGLHQRGWKDAKWSSIYRRDTQLRLRRAGRSRARGAGQPPGSPRRPSRDRPGPDDEGAGLEPGGPGLLLVRRDGRRARRSSGVACDLAGDERSARVARKVALAALLPSPPLLIKDLGRPERFYNMLRIFKPRSPMSMGSWCLTVFGSLALGVGRGRPPRAPPNGADPRRGHRLLRRVPGVLHRRAARRDGGPGVGAQPAVPGADLRLNRGADRRRHDAPGADGDRSAGRPSDVRGARPGRERRDRGRASALPGQPASPGRPCLRAGRGRRGGLVSPRPVAGPGRSRGASAAPPRPRAPRAGRERRLPERRAVLPLGLGGSGRTSAQDDEAVARMARGRATSQEPDLNITVVEHH